MLLHELPKYEKLYVDIIERAKIANEGNSGLLKIGFMEGKDHPNIAIDIFCHSFGDLRHQLAEDNLDLIYASDFLLENNPSYCYESVADNYAVALISKYHPLANRMITEFSQLKNETLIFLHKQESEELHELIRKDCQRAGFIPNIKYASSLNENIMCIELGIGVGIINQDSYGCYNPNIIVLKDLKIAKRKFVFGWKKDNINPSIALFLNYI